MINKLTQEQEELMGKVRQQWLDYIFSCNKTIDREKANISIDWLYKLSKLEKPIKIYVDSPMACQYAVLYAKEYAKILQMPSQVRSQVGSQVWSQVWSQVESQVESQVGSQVWSQVWSQVRSQVESQVGSQVESQVRSQVRSQVGSQGIAPERFASYGSIWDYGWVSFYDFFIQSGIITNNDFDKFKELLQSGIYDMIQLNGFCIVSELPNKITRNGELLHNIGDYAIQFRDGYGQHYVNGRFVPENYFNLIVNGNYSIEDFTREENEEYKSACIALMQEKYGDEYIVNFFREYLSEVDTYVDKKDPKFLEGTTKGMNVGVYTLFKGTLNGENIAYVRCYCPSTDRMFFLGVDDSMNTAKDAIASLYRLPKKLIPHIKSISRQGERYSTILTEEGKSKLKQMSESEIADVAGLSGSDYFSKIKYEF